MTLDRVVCTLDAENLWETGHGYTELSRVRSYASLGLTAELAAPTATFSNPFKVNQKGSAFAVAQRRRWIAGRGWLVAAPTWSRKRRADDML